jgi:hypothetical protein
MCCVERLSQSASEHAAQLGHGLGRKRLRGVDTRNLGTARAAQEIRAESAVFGPRLQDRAHAVIDA